MTTATRARRGKPSLSKCERCGRRVVRRVPMSPPDDARFVLHVCRRQERNTMPSDTAHSCADLLEAQGWKRAETHD